MRFDPCGRVCEIGRIPYTTRARLFRNSEIEVDIQWYPVPMTNPRLGLPTTIISRIWQGTPYDYAGTPPYPDTVGEVIGARHRPWPNVSRPDATGERICGTEEDFVRGCVYDPDAPPVVRRDDGLPMCCGLGLIPMGGIGMGGEAPMGIDTTPFSPCTNYLLLNHGETMYSTGGWTWATTSGEWTLTVDGPPPNTWTLTHTTTIPPTVYHATDWDGSGTQGFAAGGFPPPPIEDVQCA